MSDIAIRHRFAGPISAVEETFFFRSQYTERVPSETFCYGSRLENEKVKGIKHLNYALLRSAFGRSED
jgi:hypothetical protein